MRRTVAIVRMATEALSHHRLRTALSTLGIVIGVASLAAILAVGDGIESFARDQIAATTPLQLIALTPVTTRTVDDTRVPLRDEEILTLSLDDARAIRAALPDGDEAAVLQRSGPAEIRSADGDTLVVRGSATEALVHAVGAHTLVAGRGLTADEVDAVAPVAVISAALATRLGRDDAADAVGERLHLERGEVTVIGVIAEDRIDVYVPLALGDDLLLRPHERRAVLLVRAPSVEHADDWVTLLDPLVDERFGPGRLEIQAYAERIEQVRDGMRLFRAFMGAITGISLLVGGIGIMNVLLVTVTERTREFGIRKAVGARNGDLRLQLLAESVLIASVGSVMGTVLGVLGAMLVAWVMRSGSDAEIHAAFSWTSFVVAVGASVAVGLGFGLAPALRAARLSVVDAIRVE